MNPYLYRHLTLHGDLGKGMGECTYVPACMCAGCGGRLLYSLKATVLENFQSHISRDRRGCTELTTSNEIIHASKNTPKTQKNEV